MYIIYTDLHIESEYQVEANLCQSDNLLSTRLDAWGHHLCFFKVGCNWFNPQASTILSCGWRTTWCFKNLDKKAKECSTQKQRIICWSSLSAWSSWPPWVLPSWQIAHEVVVPNKIHQDCINPATFRSATHVYKNLPHLRDSFHMDHFWHFNGSFFIYHLQTAAIWSIFINRHVPQNIASCWTLDQVPLNEFQPEELQQSSLHTWKDFSEMFETTFKLKVRQKVSLAQEKKTTPWENTKPQLQLMHLMTFFGTRFSMYLTYNVLLSHQVIEVEFWRSQHIHRESVAFIYQTLIL